ncbi:hypothetical protein ABK040_007750 [Willaertia magna]
MKQQQTSSSSTTGGTPKKKTKTSNSTEEERAKTEMTRKCLINELLKRLKLGNLVIFNNSDYLEYKVGYTGILFGSDLQNFNRVFYFLLGYCPSWILSMHAKEDEENKESQIMKVQCAIYIDDLLFYTLQDITSGTKSIVMPYRNKPYILMEAIIGINNKKDVMSNDEHYRPLINFMIERILEKLYDMGKGMKIEKTTLEQLLDNMITKYQVNNNTKLCLKYCQQ